jgi:hypothetical protein
MWEVTGVYWVVLWNGSWACPYVASVTKCESGDAVDRKRFVTKAEALAAAWSIYCGGEGYTFRVVRVTVSRGRPQPPT